MSLLFVSVIALLTHQLMILAIGALVCSGAGIAGALLGTVLVGLIYGISLISDMIKSAIYGNQTDASLRKKNAQELYDCHCEHNQLLNDTLKTFYKSDEFKTLIAKTFQKESPLYEMPADAIYSLFSNVLPDVDPDGVDPRQAREVLLSQDGAQKQSLFEQAGLSDSEQTLIINALNGDALFEQLHSENKLHALYQIKAFQFIYRYQIFCSTYESVQQDVQRNRHEADAQAGYSASASLRHFSPPTGSCRRNSPEEGGDCNAISVASSRCD